MSVSALEKLRSGRPVVRNGFTLMEMLIAVTITAVIGLGVWQVLGNVVLSRDRVNEVADQFDSVQRTMLLLERDITQIVNRPGRDIYGDYNPALTSREDDFALMLTRQGWRNPLGTRRSTLQRVAWEYTGDELRRRYWVSVDQGQEDNSQDLMLLADVTDFTVRFLDDQRNWRDDWPDETSMANMTPGSRPDIPLPLGIEITLTHERFGKLVRTFTLPDFDNGQAQGIINAANESQADQDDTDTEQQGDDTGQDNTATGGQ
ncbi:type II secretion system protein GspJ [Marinobacter panjinensis]|uniref:Type II secretion system protein J n=1 Tax=Marinobacter panjinensis TaxID=2576384 RepID=A0A4U6R0F8_9GAMM|nr:type II secretion system minor pseudopilin GspJ [Marinobacter panjinensis]MCR8915678.1 type II secretion system minor pseudopilin GspJ [Marinobacter panjinensis]TKV66920.1 type II secretion system protein GspJ [Marinobacter panjinensis]